MRQIFTEKGKTAVSPYVSQQTNLFVASDEKKIIIFEKCQYVPALSHFQTA